MSEVLSRRTERRTRQRAANRSAILEAARRVTAREGTGELSLRAVAGEAGYAPASVYEYFRNRAELVLALAAEDMGGLARSLREPAPGTLAQAAKTALDAMRGSGALPAAIATLEGGDAPPEAERLFNGKLIAALTAFAEAAGRTPKTREEQADVLLAAATVTGLAVLARAGRLKTLGLEENALLERLDKRFTPPLP
ncbi:MAG TPA: helix-turn-helix domain-containing protein [Micropepsaceae bacterium]|jgi:AcrR family transcriptional regulator|nr:helix-turn-helix domain-containing protein [Micropepsaceae bacterium]